MSLSGWTLTRAAALLLVVVAALAAGLPAGAGTGRVAADPVEEARLRLEQARAEANEAARRYDATVAERARIEAEIASVVETIPKLRARELELQAIIQARVAALYRNSDAASILDITSGSDSVEAARRGELSEAATQYDADLAQELRDTAARLAQAEADLRVRRGEVDALLPRLEAERADFDGKVAAAEKALWRATIVGAVRARGTTSILGPSALAPEEIAAWFRATGGRGQVAGISIEELATIYVEEGAAAGVRGDIAFAQSIVETGSFNIIGPNNFAGLGACDSCSDMTHYPTPRDGVRAQMQHLRNYGDATSRADQLTHPPSPYWYGHDPAAAANNFNTFFAKGWAPTWEEMGAGNWATDPGYSAKVLGVYDRMIGWGVD
jgi:hypothetical protein